MKFALVPFHIQFGGQATGPGPFRHGECVPLCLGSGSRCCQYYDELAQHVMEKIFYQALEDCIDDCPYAITLYPKVPEVMLKSVFHSSPLRIRTV